MKKNKELVNILKAELTLLTKDILQNIHQKDVSELYKSTRKLYEKIAAIQVLQNQMTENELVNLVQTETKTDNTNEIFISENIKPKSDDKPENPYKNVAKMSFKPKTEIAPSPEISQPNQTPVKPVSKPFTGKKMSIGLNDRIAFINNLFDGDATAYQKAVETLNSFNTYEEALAYISHQLKPRYANWEGKDEYEFRLIQLLELKFN